MLLTDILGTAIALIFILAVAAFVCGGVVGWILHRLTEGEKDNDNCD